MKKLILFASFTLTAGYLHAAEFYSKKVQLEIDRAPKEVSLSASAIRSEEILIGGGKAVINALGFGVSGVQNFKSSCELVKQKVKVDILNFDELGIPSWTPQELNIVSAKFKMEADSDESTVIVPLLYINDSEQIQVMTGPKGIGSQTSIGINEISYASGKGDSGQNIPIEEFKIKKNSQDLRSTTSVEYYYRNVGRGHPFAAFMNIFADELDQHEFKCQFMPF